MKIWVLTIFMPVLVGIVVASWKLRTLRSQTYERLKTTVALGLAGFDKMALEALLPIRRQLPVSGFDRSIGAEDFEPSVRGYLKALRARRRLQRRFRRLLFCSVMLIIGLVLMLPTGTYVVLNAANVPRVPDQYSMLGKVGLGVAAAIAGLGYVGHLYYEARIGTPRAAGGDVASGVHVDGTDVDESQ